MYLTKEEFDIQTLLPTELEAKPEAVPFSYPLMEGNHSAFKPSEKCRENLQKLATYLLALPKGYREFDMGRWFGASERAIDGLEKETNPVCGTVACAAGHGPAAGIAPQDGETWYDYASRLACWESLATNFFFSGCWTEMDNTPQGAGKRIEYALEHGFPDYHRWNSVAKHLQGIDR